MRLIDAERLREAWLYSVGKYGIADIVLSIDCSPTIEAKPVVRGEWEDEKIVVDSELTWTNWCCSKCGYLRKQGWTHYLGGKPVANFCENCGADMRKEDNT